ncbi:PAS domain-containing sensor histidine kinase [Candidatus Woesearchaeota archaeon]|nr:PAS domain-containing sensor histidine kinase [Candidatus Woesearchaeota archaeon]
MMVGRKIPGPSQDEISGFRKKISALEAEVKKLRGLLDIVSDWVWETDAKGRYTYVNPSVRSILGYKPKEILGKTPFFFMQGEEKKKILSYFNRHSRMKRPITALKNWNISKKGHRVLLETNGAPILDNKGKLSGYIGIDKDITKEYDAGQELKKTAERIRELDEAKTNFINIISHELKTPITAISLHLELLEGMKSGMGVQQKASLDAISQNIKSLRILIDNILEISRIKAKRFELKLSKTDLAGLIKDAKTGFDIAAARKGLTIRLSLKKIPDAYIDEARTMEILNNLLSNAIKFTEEGYIEIMAQRKGRYVSISVKDTGIGIAKGRIKGLFHPFYQVEPVLAGKYGGTGLGLSISRQLAELQGGTIKVRSVKGKGSVFSFTLPIRRGAP